jgi:hypothetical protein
MKMIDNYNCVSLREKDCELLEDLWQKIQCAEKKKMARTIFNVAEEYDSMVMEFPVVPDIFVDFLLKIFSDNGVHNSKGIENFLLEINVDFLKYTKNQKERILTSLTENCGNFVDELGRHSIGDFISRAYLADIAYNAFVALANGNCRQKHVAFVGLDVLRIRIGENEKIYKDIIELRQKLLNTESTWFRRN